MPLAGEKTADLGYPYETKEIDEEIVKQTNKSNPNFLFIGFASGIHEESYYSVMQKIYTKLGCITDILKYGDLSNEKIINQKISSADIIYVGGGNTLKLMSLFRKHGIDKKLEIAYNKGTVLTGVSAGGICWCNFGNSDSRKFTSNSNNLIRVRGLSFIPILFCPHYNVEAHRQEDLKRMMKTTYNIPAIALDNGVALEIIDGEYRLIRSIKNAEARKCYWKNGEYIITPLEIANTFKDIQNLYKKD